MSASGRGTQSPDTVDSILSRKPTWITSFVSGSLKLPQPPLALQIAAASSTTDVVVWCFDRFEQHRWTSLAERCGNVTVVCQPDWPERPTDVAVLQLAHDGSAELACELFQSAWETLAVGGDLWVWVNNRRDQWTRRQLQTYASKVHAASAEEGIWYHLRKHQPAARRRRFDAEFAFRDLDQLLFVRTRPGVFSHRRLDNGARQLIRALPQGQPGRLMDLGCGSGAVALAAAQRNPAAEIVAVDSNCRALELVLQSAERNALSNLRVELNWDGNFSCGGGFDWVFTNPPYFAQHRIASQFIRTGGRVLSRSGSMTIVTKTPREIAAIAETEFSEVQVQPGPNYTLILGSRPRVAGT